MTKRILVTGKNGQLGKSLDKISKDYPLYDFIFVGRDELDYSRTDSFTGYFECLEFDYIINCAAYTAVDKAESEVELAEHVNHFAVKKLAEIAREHNAILIHISTDYVFNGQNCKPYIETDAVDPQNVYGLTKLRGEQAMQAVNPKGLIIRTSWIYSEFGQNFCKTMLKLGKERASLNVVADQVGSPTYAGDLAQTILKMMPLIESDSVEIYHYSSEGVCSWYDFAEAIFRLSETICQVLPISSSEYPTPAQRPYYSVLDSKKIKQGYKIVIPNWFDSLGRLLLVSGVTND